MQDLLNSLNGAQREHYEQMCRELENGFAQAGVDAIESLANGLPRQSPFRELAGLHLLKMWIEACSERGHFGGANDVERLLGFVLQSQNESYGTEVGQWIKQLGVDTQDLPEFLREHLPTELFNRPAHNPRLFQFPSERFEFVRELADRGMATVILVRRKSLDRLEVLKAVHAELMANPMAVERFRKEGKLLSKAESPGIVRVLDSDDSNGWPYFTMEYCPGGSLAERLVEGPLSQVQAAEHISALARALDSVHRELGLVHRDIKPANIFYQKDGKPALGDFGLAREILDSPATNPHGRRLSVLGTKGFIAPEILEQSLILPGEDEFTTWRRADVFSLGVTLYQCLTGQLPYQTVGEQVNPMGVFRIPLVRPSSIAKVDAVLDAICVRAIRREPGTRFSTARELADELEKWVASNSRVTVQPVQPFIDTATTAQKPADSRLFQNLQHYALALASTVGLLLMIILILVVTRGEPGSVQSEADAASTKSTVGVNTSDRVTTFTKAGWTPDSMAAVIAVAEPALEIIRQTNPEFAERTWQRIAALPSQGIATSSLKARPHICAALFLASSTSDRSRWMATLGETSDSALVDDMLMRFPDRQQLPAVLDSIKNYRPLLKDVNDRDWVGAEYLLLGLPKDEAVVVYAQWLKDIVMMDESDSILYLSVAMLHGQRTILPLLQKDRSFLDRFSSHVWPGFVNLIRSNYEKRYELLSEPRVWQLLNTDYGLPLLERMGPGVCELFYGAYALPSESHAAASSLLLEERKVVIECFNMPLLRQSRNFSHLLRRNLSVNELSALCAMISSQTTDTDRMKVVDRLASVDDDQLRHELENKQPGIVEKTPLIYAKVGWTLLKGERVYADEWSYVAIQGIKNLANVALPGLGASAEAVEGFIQGVDIGADLVQEGKSQAIEKLLMEGNNKLTQAEIRQAFTQPSQLTEMFVNHVRRTKTQIQKFQSEKTFDARLLCDLFYTVGNQLVKRGEVELAGDVHFLRFRLPDGRKYSVPELKTALRSVELDKFVRDRVLKLTSAEETMKEQDRQLMYQQVLFTWLLLQHPEARELSDMSNKSE